MNKPSCGGSRYFQDSKYLSSVILTSIYSASKRSIGMSLTPGGVMVFELSNAVEKVTMRGGLSEELAMEVSLSKALKAIFEA